MKGIVTLAYFDKYPCRADITCVFGNDLLLYKQLTPYLLTTSGHSQAQGTPKTNNQGQVAF